MMQVEGLLDQRAFPLGAPRGRFHAPALKLVTGIGEADNKITVRQRGLGDRQFELVRALAAVRTGGHNLQISRGMLFPWLKEQNRACRSNLPCDRVADRDMRDFLV